MVILSAMSILGSLKRLFDPIAHRQEQAEYKRKREAPAPEKQGEPLECRICGYLGPADDPHCPQCLAGTMEKKRR
jgi:hypothetical protein